MAYNKRRVCKYNKNDHLANVQTFQSSSNSDDREALTLCGRDKVSGEMTVSYNVCVY